MKGFYLSALTVLVLVLAGAVLVLDARLQDAQERLDAMQARVQSQSAALVVLAGFEMDRLAEAQLRAAEREAGHPTF